MANDPPLYLKGSSGNMRAVLYLNKKRRSKFLPPIEDGLPWALGTWYQNGATVTHSSSTYRCIQTHQAIVGREPDTATSQWVEV